MRKLKESKGITLVALIITIIVLLILAVVAISAVNGDGIISKAKNARTNYQTAQDEENTMLGKYLTDIENANNNRTKETNSSELFITHKREDNDEIYIFSKTEENLTEFDKQYISEYLEIDYSEWDKSQEGNIITYSKNFVDTKENYEYIIKMVFGMKQTVNKEYIGSLGEEDNLTYLNSESEYIYDCFLDDDYGYCWWVSHMMDKEIYTEEFKTEILGYTVSVFKEAFGGNDNVKSVPTIPITAKKINAMFDNCENISEVNYAGTLEQYKQISCYKWISDKQGFTVHCTNGDYVVGND